MDANIGESDCVEVVILNSFDRFRLTNRSFRWYYMSVLFGFNPRNGWRGQGWPL